MNFDDVYLTIVTREGVSYPLWLNQSFETFVVGRQYLFHAIPGEGESPSALYEGLHAFRCYYPKENLPVDEWVDIGLAARDAGLSCFPMVVLHNESNLLIFESIGLAKNHRYKYPYESATISRTGGEISNQLH